MKEAVQETSTMATFSATAMSAHAAHGIEVTNPSSVSLEGCEDKADRLKCSECPLGGSGAGLASPTATTSEQVPRQACAVSVNPGDGSNGPPMIFATNGPLGRSMSGSYLPQKDPTVCAAIAAAQNILRTLLGTSQQHGPALGLLTEVERWRLKAAVAVNAYETERQRAADLQKQLRQQQLRVSELEAELQQKQSSVPSVPETLQQQQQQQQQQHEPSNCTVMPENASAGTAQIPGSTTPGIERGGGGGASTMAEGKSPTMTEDVVLKLALETLRDQISLDTCIAGTVEAVVERQLALSGQGVVRGASLCERQHGPDGGVQQLGGGSCEGVAGGTHASVERKPIVNGSVPDIVFRGLPLVAFESRKSVGSEVLQSLAVVAKEQRQGRKAKRKEKQQRGKDESMPPGNQDPGTELVNQVGSPGANKNTASATRTAMSCFRNFSKDELGEMDPDDPTKGRCFTSYRDPKEACQRLAKWVVGAKQQNGEPYNANSLYCMAASLMREYQIMEDNLAKEEDRVPHKYSLHRDPLFAEAKLQLDKRIMQKQQTEEGRPCKRAHRANSKSPLERSNSQPEALSVGPSLWGGLPPVVKWMPLSAPPAGGAFPPLPLPFVPPLATGQGPVSALVNAQPQLLRPPAPSSPQSQPVPGVEQGGVVKVGEGEVIDSRDSFVKNLPVSIAQHEKESATLGFA